MKFLGPQTILHRIPWSILSLRVKISTLLGIYFEVAGPPRHVLRSAWLLRRRRTDENGGARARSKASSPGFARGLYEDPNCTALFSLKQVQAHMYIYMYTYVCIYIYTCVCVYIYLMYYILFHVYLVTYALYYMAIVSDTATTLGRALAT